MKKLYTAVDRFCARHPRFGISDLLRWIVIGNVAVYILMLLTMRADANALAFLYLDGGKVLRGEIWRIITFIFVPASSSPFWLAVSLYFYYWIGTSLERQWGTARFNLYYWSGVLLTAIVTIVASAISGTGYPVGGTEYVNLSMFLAFAFLFPDTRLLLFFFIPVKIKWLAWLDIAVFVIGIIQSLLVGSWLGAIATGLLPPLITAALGISLYAMFIGLLMPGLHGNGRLAALVVLTALCNTVLCNVVQLDSGWSMILSTLGCAALGSFFVTPNAAGEENSHAEP